MNFTIDYIYRVAAVASCAGTVRQGAFRSILCALLLLVAPHIAVAQGFTANFGPNARFNDSPQNYSIAVSNSLTSDATITIQLIGDLNSSNEEMIVRIDGVEVTRFNQGQCIQQSRTITVPQATMAPLIADGQIVLQFDPEPGTNTLSSCDGSGVLAGLNNVAFAVAGTLSFDAGAVASATVVTKRTIANFVSRRADQLTINDPSLASRLDSNNHNNGQPTSQGGNPFSFSGSNLGGNTDVVFGTSLRQIAGSNKARKKKITPAGDKFDGKMTLGHGIDGTVVSNKFDIWVKGKWLKIDSGTSDSKLGLLYLAADYRLSPSLLVGFLAQLDWANEDNSAVGSKVDGRGWMIGPYLVTRLHQKLLFDGRIAWGRSNNKIKLANVGTDNFDTNRWLVRGRLTGDIKQGRWHVAPHVGLIYFEEDQKSFTDNLGRLIDKQTISLGRITFGPKISTNYSVGASVLSPFVALTGIWDFKGGDTSNVITGIGSKSKDLHGRVEVGASLKMLGGIALTGAGFYDGIGAGDFKAYGGSVKVRVPLN